MRGPPVCMDISLSPFCASLHMAHMPSESSHQGTAQALESQVTSTCVKEMHCTPEQGPCKAPQRHDVSPPASVPPPRLVSAR